MTRSQLREIVKRNLNDAGAITFQDEEINQSLQDAYNDIASKTQCIVKSVTLNWLSQVNYYDFLNGNGDPTRAVSDFLGTISIFNNNSNLWLRDDMHQRDFDKVRVDWELWSGQPQFWAPKCLQYSIVVPRLYAATGTFDLWYWAKAPIWTDEDDLVTEPLVASDMQDLFEYFSTADLLSSVEEPLKAMAWWKKYFETRQSYKERCRNNAMADLLPRI